MQATEPLQIPESIGKRVDPTYSKVLQLRLKELLNSQNDSFPGSQPVSFESKHLIDIEREDYFVCEKSDGVRYLLFFLHSPKGPASFLFDRNKHWYYVPNLLFPVRGRENEFLKDTLMDGELVLDIDANKVHRADHYLSTYWADGMLQQDIIQPFNARMRTQIDPAKLPPFTIELKKMERSYGLHLVFEQIPKLKHKSDGIIWTPVKYPYTPGTCEKLLKWKLPELNTVDFRIGARWSKEHKPIYSIEVLSNGVTYKFYDHFQPEPALATQWKNQLPDGRIAEFRYDPQCEVTIIEQGYAPTVRKGGWRFVRFRDDKSTANDEQVVKKILNSIQDGVTKEQLLACMDRVRAAWKAREKGLPMPPLPSKAPGNLTLTTQITPTASVSSTPTSSSVLQSPGFPSASSGYFRESHDNSSRSNSISEEPPTPMKRKSSTPSVTTPLKESVEVKEDESVDKKRLKSLVEEEPQQSSASTSTSATSTSLPSLPGNVKIEKADVEPQFSNNVNEHHHPSRQTHQQPIALRKQQGSQQMKSEEPRSRKTSFVEGKAAPDLQLPPSSSAKVNKIPAVVNTHSVRTLSAPAIAALPEAAATAAQTASPKLNKAEYEDNRRSKSIPQLPKETIMQTQKKAKSSSSIHNLLTTSVEPTPNKRAYDFSNILQQNKRSSPVQQQPQPQPQASHQQLQQQVHYPQYPPLQQQQPVQFINFHAEGRQSPQQMNKNHVLIIRSESNSQPGTTTQQQRVWKNSSSNNSVNNNVKYENHTPTPPPRSQSPSSHIAPSQESYSPYNNHAVPTPYHHLSPQTQPPPPPQQQQQQPFHPSYYGQYQHQSPQAPTPPPLSQQKQQHPAHMYGYRRNEQPVAHSYQQQQQQSVHRQQPYPQSPHPPPQQNTTQPSSSSPMSPPKRKNSQKAKLDFILN
ncbi:MRNA capping enzyme, alpha subunit [Mucor ambiguus]|uniref:mRNA guanylyltransferase n=1 Tax=Mucor ambiguus TaxID=91626 RepID=A0A0C9MQC7_9FUNG|nr:MRNA capping enzyme, alpha subunit [Mucor ambiguus]